MDAKGKSMEKDGLLDAISRAVLHDIEELSLKQFVVLLYLGDLWHKTRSVSRFMAMTPKAAIRMLGRLREMGYVTSAKVEGNIDRYWRTTISGDKIRERILKPLVVMALRGDQ